MSFLGRLKNSWNAFRANEQKQERTTEYYDVGESYYPDTSFPATVERTPLNNIINRISVDVSSVNIRHCLTDEEGNYQSTKRDKLNSLISVQANKDQTGREFVQDLIQSMLSEGVVAAVATDWDDEPKQDSPGYVDIFSVRVGKILQWYPDHIQVEVFDDRTGKRKQIIVPKAITPILQNPFYEIMNAPNSKATRLRDKLYKLDQADNSSDPSKLDLILQLPYDVSSTDQKARAKSSTKALESQLTGSKFGIGYIGATDKVIQLNRSIENNLLKEIEYFSKEFKDETGVTAEILNGTASEAAMLNYNNRTLEPILTLMVEQFDIKWLSETARSERHKFMYFRDPYKLVPFQQLTEGIERLRRNEIIDANEGRQFLGLKPSMEDKANELYNPNQYRQDMPSPEVPQPGEYTNEAPEQNYEEETYTQPEQYEDYTDQRQYY